MEEEEEDKVATVVNKGNSKQDNIALMKKYSLKTAQEAQKKYLEMKQERRELRIKLDKFQKDFESANNRKIRYTKDIAPVANDFKRYKDMKGELLKLEVLV